MKAAHPGQNVGNMTSSTRDIKGPDYPLQIYHVLDYIFLKQHRNGLFVTHIVRNISFILTI